MMTQRPPRTLDGYIRVSRVADREVDDRVPRRQAGRSDDPRDGAAIGSSETGATACAGSAPSTAGSRRRSVSAPVVRSTANACLNTTARIVAPRIHKSRRTLRQLA
jgi:hypothetical protein